MTQSHSSLLGGTMIIAGTAIGAGMLANPTATSGLWFLGSIIMLIYVWTCMSLSGLLLLEANQYYPEGSSFHTLVKDLLGPYWNFICGFAVVFVLYSLTYAYIFVGGGLTQKSLHLLQIPISRPISASTFLIILACCVSASTHWVGRFSVVLIAAMMITFLLASSGLLAQVKISTLLNQPDTAVYWHYGWLALPVCLASFGFHGNVPGLFAYYRGNTKAVATSIVAGSGLALIVYIIWQLAVQGNLPRNEFAPVLAADGDVTVLLNALNTHINTQGLSTLLDSFAFLAIISSFLGVTLGLFDYIRDLFGFSNTLKGRISAAVITFMPPWLAYLWMPNGFIKVMGYIGLMAAIWAVIIPAMLAFKSRQRFAYTDAFVVPGGKFTLGFVIFFALLVLGAQLLLLANLLPTFKG